MAFIRPFKSTDEEMAMHICRATLPPSLASNDAAYRIAPYLWTLQYTHLSPSTCFVLDDGSGRAVGYVIGCADAFAFADAYPRYVDEVLLGSERGRADVPVPEQLETLEPWSVPADDDDDDAKTGGTRVNAKCLTQLAYNVRWLLLEGVPGKAELVRTYRATMHIDLLPEFQGRGWGGQLVDRFVESVKLAVAATEQQQPQLDCGRGVHIGVAGENTKVLPFYEKLQFRVYEGGEREGNVWMVRDISVG